MKKITFIGLGVMGSQMARHLATHGNAVTVYNRTAEKAHEWQKKNSGTVATDLQDSVRDADFVIACVGDDNSIRDITLGKGGVFKAMKRGAIFIDHTTTSAIIARECNMRAREKGLYFLDAPVSGGQDRATTGKLIVMCGGHRDAYEKAEQVILNYARECRYMGKSGAGQLTKMVNQIAIAGLLQGLSEAIYFAEKARLDTEQVIKVIQQGAAQSWQMDSRYQTMIAGDYNFGFAVDWMRKDLGICLEQARKAGTSLPVTELVNTYYRELQDMGHGRSDTSALVQRMRIGDPDYPDEC